MESVWSVSKLSTESVGSRRELVANCVHTADAFVASAVCIGHYPTPSRRPRQLDIAYRPRLNVEKLGTGAEFAGPENDGPTNRP